MRKKVFFITKYRKNCLQDVVSKLKKVPNKKICFINISETTADNLNSKTSDF